MRLRVDQLHGLLLHRAGGLLGPASPAHLSALDALKDSRWVNQVGASIYAPDILESLFGLRRFEMVQSPISILDQRLINSGWTRRRSQMPARCRAAPSRDGDQGADPPRPTHIDADHCAAITSRPVGQLMASLGVSRSHSGPHTSNDNPTPRANSRRSRATPTSQIASRPSTTPSTKAAGSPTCTTATTATETPSCRRPHRGCWKDPRQAKSGP